MSRSPAVTQVPFGDPSPFRSDVSICTVEAMPTSRTRSRQLISGRPARSFLPAAIAAAALFARPVPGQLPSSLRTVQPVSAPRFPLPPEPATADSTHFSFIFYGGMRGRADGEEIAFEHSLVVQTMIDTINARKGGSEPIRFILSNGDAVLDGRDPKQWNISWLPLVDRLTTEGGLPFYMAAGNHDVTESPNVNNAGRRDGMTNYLRATARLIPANGSPRRLGGYPTFTVGYGNTFIITFDSNIGDDRRQFEWVKGQLDSLDRKRYPHVIAMAHHPAFSSGLHGGPVIERPTASIRNRWMPLFRKHHVRLLLVGHDHLYEHWVERYRDSTGWHRLDQIVSGGGGSPLYVFRGEPDVGGYVKNGAADSVRVDHVVRPGRSPSENPYHFTVIHVDGDQLTLEVIGVAGGESFRPYGTPRVSLNDPPRP